MASARSATASTGDLKNNTMKLLREIQRMKLPLEPDIQGLTLGCPSAFLPVLHSSFMHYSLPLAKWLTRHGYDLYSKTDLRFLEGMYKVMRDVFHYRPQLTREQFLSTGFTERKVLLTLDVLCFCQAKHGELVGGRGRGSRRGRRKEVVGQGKAPDLLSVSEKPEVLTIQERSGISSAWSEPLRVEVESAGNSRTSSQSSFPYTLPPSPPHPPPHSLTTVHSPLDPATPTTILEATPNPTPLKYPPPGTSLHPSTPRTSEAAQRLVPVTASHGEEILALRALQLWPPGAETSHPPGLVVRHAPPPCSTPTQHAPPPTTAAGDVDAKSQGASEGDEPVRTTAVPDAGQGMPQGRTGSDSPESWYSLPLRREEETEVEGGTATTQSGAQLDATNTPLGDISIRVEQLAQQVEKMTARFVLLETRLKMAESPRSEPAMSSTRGRENSLTQTTAPPHRTASVGARDLQRNISPMGSSKELLTPLPNISRSSLGFTEEAVPGTPSRAGMRGQLIQPHKPILHTHTVSHTPSASLQPTPHHSVLWSQTAAPSTPEDTRLMIENLRGRAQRTRDLLQKVNTAHGSPSR